MRTEKVVVLPYDKSWKEEFEKIKNEIMDALGDIALSIEHVGSTSVEGLAAKPVIDVDIVVKREDIMFAIGELEGICYIYEGNLGIVDREAFRYKGKDHLMCHHLYVCPEDSSELKRHITFRDYLREHKEAVREYGEVKLKGAELYPDDIEKYIEYKSPVIEKIYRLAGLV